MARQASEDSPLVRLLQNPAAPFEHALETARAMLEHALELAPVVVTIAVALMLARAAVIRLRDRQRARGARLVRIGVPPEVEADGALLLWSSLHDLLRPRLARLLVGQPQLAWEITAGRAGSEFRAWIPASVPPGLVERALASAWPGVTLRSENADGDPLPVQDALAATEYGLSGPEWFPLRADGPDPLRLLLGQLTGLTDGEHALIQIIARPATSREQRTLRATACRLRTGISPHRIVRLLDFFQSHSQVRPAFDPTLNPDIRAVLDKTAHPLYRCCVRAAVSTPDRRTARGRIHAISGALAAYQGRVGLRRHRLVGARRRLRERSLTRRAFLLSTPELAALAHLPTEAALPGLVRASARSVTPPPGLPADGKPLGRSSSDEPVSLAVADARYHLHLLGPTGVGKSTLIARLALDDLVNERGAVVIDPKGDLVEDILARIPKALEDRVDLLDPLDPSPPGLNILEGDDHDLVVDQIVGIFHRVYERFWGPRTDDILRATLLTLLRAGSGRTLADVPKLLTDDAWRQTLTTQIDDPVGLGSFWAWYDELGETTRAQATGPVLNKLRTFLLRRSVRTIVGQSRSTIDVAGCLDHGRLLLARVPKGTLGEDTSRLLGSFVAARVWQAALARARQPEHARRDAALYVDEVHNYLSLPTPLAEMLAEARGYRLSLCLAHQHLGQLPREMREALAANARTKILFQLSPEDAAALERLVAPELSAHDLATCPPTRRPCASAGAARQATPSPSTPSRSRKQARSGSTRSARPPATGSARPPSRWRHNLPPRTARPRSGRARPTKWNGSEATQGRSPSDRNPQSSLRPPLGSSLRSRLGSCPGTTGHTG